MNDQSVKDQNHHTFIKGSKSLKNLIQDRCTLDCIFLVPINNIIQYISPSLVQ